LVSPSGEKTVHANWTKEEKMKFHEDKRSVSMEAEETTTITAAAPSFTSSAELPPAPLHPLHPLSSSSPPASLSLEEENQKLKADVIRLKRKLSLWEDLEKRRFEKQQQQREEDDDGSGGSISASSNGQKQHRKLVEKKQMTWEKVYSTESTSIESLEISLGTASAVGGGDHSEFSSSWRSSAPLSSFTTWTGRMMGKRKQKTRISREDEIEEDLSDDDYGNKECQGEDESMIEKSSLLVEDHCNNNNDDDGKVHGSVKKNSNSSNSDEEEEEDENDYYHTVLSKTLFDRGGWLVGLLVLQSMSSFILKRNEELLQSHVVIVQFLTMLVGAGGNAGNQASVRGRYFLFR